MPSPSPALSCVDARFDARGFREVCYLVACCHVSGLGRGMCSAAGPYGESEDEIHIIGTRSRRCPCVWFFRSRLADVVPYLSFAPPTSPTASRSSPLLSGDDRSSVSLPLGD